MLYEIKQALFPCVRDERGIVEKTKLRLVRLRRGEEHRERGEVQSKVKAEIRKGRGFICENFRTTKLRIRTLDAA